MHVDNALLFMLGNYLQRVSIPLRSAQQMPRDAPDLIRFVCPSFRPSFRRRTGLRDGRHQARRDGWVDLQYHGVVLGEYGRGAVPDTADHTAIQSWNSSFCVVLSNVERQWRAPGCLALFVSQRSHSF